MERHPFSLSDARVGGLHPWNLVAGSLADLAIPGAVAVDQSYFDRLGIKGLGASAEIRDQKVEVTAVTKGIRAFTTTPYVFTSLDQARAYVGTPPNKATYFLVRLAPSADVEGVRGRLRTALALDVRGEPSRAAIAKSRKALAAVGLLHKMKSFPRQLSGGEQQRVAIARAIVGNPSAILADEPTSALDGENGQAIMKVLAQIAKDQARGVLVVAHDPRIVPFADRIVRIEDGRIVGEETPGSG
jgi:ABC-type dipeptide/oligopeptide/nickel transport system ATPase component